MKKRFIGFHGDLDFFSLGKLPKGAKLVGKTKEHVAQLGTATGHRHLMRSAEEFEVYQIEEKATDGSVVLHFIYVLTAQAEISHEEHRTLVFEPGIYYQDQENEESAQSGLIQPVID